MKLISKCCRQCCKVAVIFDQFLSKDLKIIAETSSINNIGFQENNMYGHVP